MNAGIKTEQKQQRIFIRHRNSIFLCEFRKYSGALPFYQKILSCIQDVALVECLALKISSNLEDKE